MSLARRMFARIQGLWHPPDAVVDQGRAVVRSAPRGSVRTRVPAWFRDRSDILVSRRAIALDPIERLA